MGRDVGTLSFLPRERQKRIRILENIEKVPLDTRAKEILLGSSTLGISTFAIGYDTVEPFVNKDFDFPAVPLLLVSSVALVGYDLLNKKTTSQVNMDARCLHL